MAPIAIPYMELVRYVAACDYLGYHTNKQDCSAEQPARGILVLPGAEIGPWLVIE